MTYFLRNFLFLFLFLSNFLFFLRKKAKVVLFFLLLNRVVLALMLGWFFSSWLGYIFFLVMVGGVLVLVLYIVSLSRKPFFSDNQAMRRGYWAMFFFVFLVFWGGGLLCLPAKNLSGNLLDLFSKNTTAEISVVVVFLLRLMWIISKVIFVNRGSLRPYFC